MKPVPPLQESELPEPAPRAPKSKPVKPVPQGKTIRETTHRVSPSRASARPVERHDQPRQQRGGRKKAE